MKYENCIYVSLRQPSEDKFRAMIKNLGGASVILVDGTNALIQIPSTNAQPYLMRLNGSMLVNKALFCKFFTVE